MMWPVFASGIGLFLAGVALAYFAVIPAGLRFFLDYNKYLGIRSQAVRWEGLQIYRVSWEDDRVAAWRRGDPLPPNADVEASLRTIRQITESGRRIVRIRGIHEPVSEYTRYEIEVAYPSNAAAGEEVYVVDLDAHPEFAAVGDFVIFDETMIAM